MNEPVHYCFDDREDAHPPTAIVTGGDVDAEHWGEELGRSETAGLRRGLCRVVGLVVCGVCEAERRICPRSTRSRRLSRRSSHPIALISTTSRNEANASARAIAPKAIVDRVRRIERRTWASRLRVMIEIARFELLDCHPFLLRAPRPTEYDRPRRFSRGLPVTPRRTEDGPRPNLPGSSTRQVSGQGPATRVAVSLRLGPAGSYTPRPSGTWRWFREAARVPE